MDLKVDIGIVCIINIVLSFMFPNLFFDITLMDTLASFSFTGGLGFYVLSISGVLNSFLFLCFIEAVLVGFLSFMNYWFRFKRIGF